MKYTKATDYALHIVEYIIKNESQKYISLQNLASNFRVSPTYLSKIMTQLTKAGIVRSSTGKNGGYCLQMPKKEISFLDVIRAVEGNGYSFTQPICQSEPCRIQNIMREAEQRELDYLERKKICELAES